MVVKNKLILGALLLTAFVCGGLLFLAFSPGPCLEERHDPTPYLNDIAVVIFLIYCFFVALIFLISWLQHTQVFAHIRRLLKIPAILSGLASQVLGALLVYRYLLADSTEFVFAPLGGILIVVGFAAILWALASEEAAAKYLRVIVFTISFLLSLLWLRYFGADTLKF